MDIEQCGPIGTDEAAQTALREVRRLAAAIAEPVTIGRIVHYHDATDTRRAHPEPAIVTHVQDGLTLDLMVFHRNGIVAKTSVPMGETVNGTGFWGWPPRV